MKAVMISGRTLAQGAGCEDKMSRLYIDEVSCCYLSEEDYRALGLSDGMNLLLTSPHGSAVLRAGVDKGLPKGMVFIPMGPWANMLTGTDTKGCGMPGFKGVEVEVTPTDEKVLDIRELMLRGR
ncbi:molybdopterin dinucleotide binding domain-containing protein [Methanothrix sp.]|uniref:molybdopterin dinucleotide binding domain-containing protein n=1 Tax=Methanothrix sp. TaxID=90426 RepID=UPI002CC3500C|nr:molybdopterin dinucleotide binding domain-containing protein [Methanothrix sp.]HOK58965.1 molybdopterin dinucleotide binding domain-containing protein [Methanothrix sp.]HOL44248.1 molybdopterin dinucleotide binding domain-containing protein [Methanothrix sp.]HPO89226.1 molybdopterin dinucleotide binding domain-containing protein [Methanothrix sp.]